MTVMKPKAKRASHPADGAAHLDRICAALATSLGAVKGRALSKDAVTVDGKIVAFVTRGLLVVKLPPERIAALIDAGEAEPMRMGARVMREWVSVAPEFSPLWMQLAEESARYVISAGPGKKRRPARRS